LATATPTGPGQRIQSIDALRGFALFGVLLVNMAFFKSPIMMKLYTPLDYTGIFNQAAAWLVVLLAEGKFYPIFSFLFGLGFFIFIQRAEEKGLGARKLFLFRMLSLLCFGIIHLTLFWYGDILHTYALTGFLLLLFHRKSLKSLRRWIVALFIIALLMTAFVWWMYGLGMVFAPEEMAPDSRAMEIYSAGGFMEIASYRVGEELSFTLVGNLFFLPGVLALFLCGVYAGRLQVFSRFQENAVWLKKVWKVSLGVALPGMLLYILLLTGVIPVQTLYWYMALETAKYVFSIPLSFFYITSFVFLLQRDSMQRFMRPLADVGRMALTNYLSQTLICVLIFYGFGLGLYGQLPFAVGVLLTFLIYTLQVFWSRAWLERFQYGPMEWIWRMMTYRKRFTISKE